MKKAVINNIFIYTTITDDHEDDTVCFISFSADSLVSYAGERFDFVLHANKKVGNYWMRFRGLMDCDERFTKAHQVAVLHYVGAPLNKEPPGEVSYEEAHRKGLVSMEYPWKGA